MCEGNEELANPSFGTRQELVGPHQRVAVSRCTHFCCSQLPDPGVQDSHLVPGCAFLEFNGLRGAPPPCMTAVLMSFSPTLADRTRGPPSCWPRVRDSR